MLLTRKHRMFCRAYIINFSPTDAGMSAGYKSRKSARVHGNKLLKKPAIQEYIKHLTARRSKRLEITADKVLQEFAKIAFADVGAFYDSEGHLKPFTALSPDDRAAIAGITYDKNLLPILKLHDKHKALDSVARHLGLYEKDNIPDATSKLTAEEISKAVADGLPD